MIEVGTVGAIALVAIIQSSIITLFAILSIINPYDRSFGKNILKFSGPILLLSIVVFEISLIHISEAKVVTEKIPVSIVNNTAIIEFDNEELNLNEIFKRNFDQKEYDFVIRKAHESVFGLFYSDDHILRIRNINNEPDSKAN